MARRRLAPVPMRRSVRMPMWAVAITSPPGGARAVFDAPVGAVRVRARYAVLPGGFRFSEYHRICVSPLMGRPFAVWRANARQAKAAIWSISTMRR